MPKKTLTKRKTHPYVDSGSKLGRKNPVIRGTRMKVIDIALRYELMGMTPDRIVEDFPHLTLPQIHDALSFYYENKSELDRGYLDDQTALEELKRQYASKLSSKLV